MKRKDATAPVWLVYARQSIWIDSHIGLMDRMKRRISFSAVVALAGVLAMASACSSPDHPNAPGQSDTTNGWMTPPLVETVERTPSGLILRGQVSPMGRVVLETGGAAAYAATADAKGQFEIRTQPLTVDTVFHVEIRNGQDASPAAYRILASRDPLGPVALIAPGAATQRLDPSGALDAIDSDGSALLASGRGRPGATVTVSVNDSRPISVEVGANGRWKTMLGHVGGGPLTIRINDKTYAYPGAGGSGAGLLEPVAGGWRAAWTVSRASHQTTWFPARS